jgi:hypothetical protein
MQHKLYDVAANLRKKKKEVRYGCTSSQIRRNIDDLSFVYIDSFGYNPGTGFNIALHIHGNIFFARQGVECGGACKHVGDLQGKVHAVGGIGAGGDPDFVGTAQCTDEISVDRSFQVDFPDPEAEAGGIVNPDVGCKADAVIFHAFQCKSVGPGEGDVVQAAAGEEGSKENYYYG